MSELRVPRDSRNAAQDRAISEIFEAQAELHPERIAISHGNQALTYAQLNQRANQVARHLQAVGLEREGLVGLCMRRSIGLIVSKLAILKAGGAYVPLDPDYPQERLGLMLQDTRLPLVLCEADLVARLPEGGGQRLVAEHLLEAASGLSPRNLGTRMSPDQLAYVIYTSGSTGRPKGISIPQRGVVRLVCNPNYIQLGPDERIAQASTVSFDAATFEIWAALLNGAELVVLDREVVVAPQALARELRERRLTTLCLTPALFNQVVLDVPDAFAPLTNLLLGGEALEPKRVRAAMEAGGPKRLLNAYGPTECTTYAATHAVTDVTDGTSAIPIGTAISETELHVLDEELEPVPVGVAGELYISGKGLARGYLHAPALTAERFLPNPLSSEPGARMYKTGDIARQRKDGAIVFMGRSDHQVKLRGFRIELGEVEAALLAHPAVAQAIAVVREFSPGDKRLLAYVLAAERVELSSGVLRGWLETKLPRYMLPSAVLVVDAFPLTHNGKVDQAKLPLPRELMEADRRQPYVAPRDGLELQLQKLWEELLGVSPVGVQSNFFDLGGHSLLAVQLGSRVRQQFGHEPPMGSFYERPTIEALAEHFRDQVRAGRRSPIVAIHRAGTNPRFYCVHSVIGSIMRYVDLSRAMGAGQPFFALEARGQEDGQQPHQSIEAMARDYVDAILEDAPEGPYCVGGWSMGGLVAFEMARLLRQAGRDVGLVALLDTWTPEALRSASDRPMQDATRRPDWSPEVKNDAEAIAMVVNTLGIPMSTAVLEQVTSDEQWEFIWQQARTTNALAAAMGPVRFRRALQVMQANTSAAEKYVPQPYEGRVVLFEAEGGTPPQVRARALGWLDVIRPEQLERCPVPGAHRTLLSEVNIPVLGRRIREYLERVAAGWR
nr:amino acid adenylation domain-containing protein [Myxococcus vastator]